MSSTGITEAISRQFLGSFKMLRQSTENIPEDKWYAGGKSWSYAWTVYHVVECADALLRIGTRDFHWLGKIGLSWSEIKRGDDFKNKVLPRITKTVVLDYLQEVESNLSTMLEALTDEDLLLADESGKDEGLYETVLERLIYLLRHQHHHLGELSKALRDWDCEKITWTAK